MQLCQSARLRCGAYMRLGGRSGGKPRLKDPCPGKAPDKSGRNQLRLWERGQHPGGAPRLRGKRVPGAEAPPLRQQGFVPEDAQERYLA